MKMVIFLIASLFPIFAFAGDFAGGDGTSGNPYQITTVVQLDKVRNYSTGKYFILMNDLDLNVAPYNTGFGWNPIYNDRVDASVFFNGNGKTISNLKILTYTQSSTGTYYGVGLFACLYKGSIRNLGLKDVYIDASYMNGYLMIDKTVPSGIGTIIGSAIGGISGTTINEVGVTGCWATGEIYGNFGKGCPIGGIVGITNFAAVENCWTNVKIGGAYGEKGEDHVDGGIVGCAGYGTAANGYNIVSNSYSLSTSDFTYISLPVVGSFLYTNYKTLRSFYLCDSTVFSANQGTPKTSGELMMISTFSKWDFTNTWSIDDGASKPYFNWQTSHESINNKKPVITRIPDQTVNNMQSFTTIVLDNFVVDSNNADNTIKWTITGNSGLIVKIDNSRKVMITYPVNFMGTEKLLFKATDPYGVFDTCSVTFTVTYGFAGGTGTAADPFNVATVSQLDSVRYFPDKNFRLKNDLDLNSAPYNTDSGWTPICNGTTKFTGSFDGNGKVISNLFINRIITNGIGLFGYLSHAVVKNIGVKNCTITGQNCVAGIAGYSYDTSLISGSFVTGTISGKQYVGGIAGTNNNSTIENSYNLAAINGSVSYLGGLAGDNANPAAVIRNSYNAGTVSGSTINTGGCVGYQGSTSTLLNTFYDSTVCGQHDNSGRGTPKETAELKSRSVYTGWDFVGEVSNGTNEIWGMSSIVNGGYPFLTWQGYQSEAVINKWPIASEITYGNKLSNVLLTGGSADLPGDYIFVNPDSVPDAGTRTYQAIFKPQNVSIKPDTAPVYVTILKKKLNIIGVSASDKTYDGTFSAKISDGILDSVLSNDKVAYVN